MTDVFLAAVERGDLNAIDQALDSAPTDGDTLASVGVRRAAKCGQLKVIEHIWPVYPKRLGIGTPLALALNNGHTACAQWLAGHLIAEDIEAVCHLVVKHNATAVLLTIVAHLPHPQLHSLITSCAQHGQTDNVALLVPHLAERPRALHDALVAAVKGQKIDTVRLLLRHTHPRNNKSEALQWASATNNSDIFDLLATRCDAKTAWESMQNSWFSKEHCRLVEAAVTVQAQKTALIDEIGQRGKDSVARKM